MPVAFQPFTAQTWSDPWPTYRALRDDGPVHHVPAQHGTGKRSPGYYVLPRHAEVWWAASQPELLSATTGAVVDHSRLGPLRARGLPPRVLQDKPDHLAFRGMVQQGLAPALEKLETKVRALATERIERLRADGGGDIVAELFRPVPAMVVADYLGVPQEDRVHFDQWSEAVTTMTTAAGGLPNALAKVFGELATMRAYFTELIRLRRVVPGDDAVSRLVAAGLGAADGDDTGMQSLLSFVFAMTANGIDTTTGMLGAATQLLHQRPDQRRLLIEDPGLIAGSVDELLRLASPVQAMSRTATRDVVVGETMVAEGSQVLLLYGSANRDERQYGPDAGELDVRRDPAQVVTFGGSTNRCLGIGAARMQLRVVLTELLARCPDFEVEEAGIIWANSSHVRRPLVVPIRVGS